MVTFIPIVGGLPSYDKLDDKPTFLWSVAHDTPIIMGVAARPGARYSKLLKIFLSSS